MEQVGRVLWSSENRSPWGWRSSTAAMVHGERIQEGSLAMCSLHGCWRHFSWAPQWLCLPITCQGLSGPADKVQGLQGVPEPQGTTGLLGQENGLQQQPWCSVRLWGYTLNLQL